MEEERPSLGKRIRHFFTLVGAIFALTVGVMVAQRLSADAIALLIGLTAGVAVMIPLLALLVFIWRRQESRYEEGNRRGQASQQPQIIVVSPPLLPGYGQQPPALGDHREEAHVHWSMAPAERHFTIVGGEG
ncbi:MAG: hypothetical protein ACP5HM_09745 [Anaerolineae bacterium]